MIIQRCSVLCAKLILIAVFLVGLVFSSSLLMERPAALAGKNTHSPFALPTPLVLNSAPLLRLDAGSIHVMAPQAKDLPSSPSKQALQKQTLDQVRSFKDLKVSNGAFVLDLRKQAVINPEHVSAKTVFTGGALSRVLLEQSKLTILQDLGAPLTILIPHGQFDFDLEDGSLEGTGTFLAGEMETAFKMNLTYATDESPSELTITVENKVFKGRYEGHLAAAKALSLNGQASFKIHDIYGFSGVIQKLLMGLGAEAPGRVLASEKGLSKTALSAEGQIEWQGMTGHFKNAKFMFGEHRATGRLRLQFGDENPDLSGTLAYETLDLTPLLFTSMKQNQEGQEPSFKEVFDFERLSQLLYGFIRHMDADLRISAKKVAIGPLEMTDGGFSLFQKKGTLIIDLANAVLLEGQTGGHLKIDTHAPKLRWHLNAGLNKLDLKSLSKLWGRDKLLEGRGDFKLQLTSFGDKKAEFYQNLSGALLFDVAEGGVLALDMHQFAMDRALSLKESLAAIEANDTKFTRLETISHFEKGQLVTDFAALATETHEYTAQGAIDLLEQTIDWHLASWRLVGPKSSLSDDKGAFIFHDAEAPMMLFCTHILGPWGTPFLEKVTPLHLSLLNKSCPAVYRPETLNKGRDPIVRPDQTR